MSKESKEGRKAETGKEGREYIKKQEGKIVFVLIENLPDNVDWQVSEKESTSHALVYRSNYRPNLPSLLYLNPSKYGSFDVVLAEVKKTPFTAINYMNMLEKLELELDIIRFNRRKKALVNFFKFRWLMKRRNTKR